MDTLSEIQMRNELFGKCIGICHVSIQQQWLSYLCESHKQIIMNPLSPEQNGDKITDDA